MERQFYITINGTKVPVTEEVYRAYKRPIWAERKRKERESRCLDTHGNRCGANCEQCTRQRTGNVFSLDHISKKGFDVQSEQDVVEIVADRLLLEELAAALDELEPDERALVNALFYDDRTERNYAARIGITQQAVDKRKHKIIEKLRVILNVGKKT